MLEALQERLAKARAKRDTAAAEVPELLLDGEEAKLKARRRLRDRAAGEVRDIEDAIACLSHRKRKVDEDAEAERKRAAREEAKRIAAERIQAARVVDQALSALEAAVTKHEALGRDLAKAMSAAGCPEAGRISRAASQNLRWAAWRSADTAADLMGVPFANGRRRKSLAELNASSTPRLDGT